MCIVLPPAPVAASPAPTPAPVPPPPPAPAPLPGNPPGPPAPSAVIDMANSLIIAPNGVSSTFAAALANGGFSASVGSGSSGTVRIRTVLQNVTGTVTSATLLVAPQYTQMVITPTSPQVVSIPANNYITVEQYATVSNGGGGTYNVTISCGTSSIVIPIAFEFLNP